LEQEIADLAGATAADARRRPQCRLSYLESLPDDALRIVMRGAETEDRAAA
jgi:hypothetical protein